jgi:mono/diheme cytochrome c family protein
MKYHFALLTVLVCVIFLQCATRNKVTYDIPANYPEARRKEIIELFNKGKVLYKANCSECHGIFTKGKDNVPDFTNQQLDNYSSRYIKGDLKNHAVARQMSPEQLNNVLLFLRYKKTKKTDSTAALRVKL